MPGLASSVDIRILNPSPRSGERRALLCPVTGLEGRWDQPGRGRVPRTPLPSCPSPEGIQTHSSYLALLSFLPTRLCRNGVIYCPPRGKCSPSYRALQPAERRKPVPGPQQILGGSKIRGKKHRGSKLVHEKAKCYLNFPFGD